jgi:GT2 family glycosyltransferase
VSRGKNATPEQAARLAKEASYIMQRWGGVLGNDPAYNPNLSLTSTAFELSQRYLVKPVFNEDAIHVNPCVDPYFYESNIERCNTVMRSAAQPPAVVQSRSSGLSIIILTLEKFDLISALLNNLVEVRKKLASEGSLSIEIIVGDTGSRDAKVLDLYEQLGAEITLVSGLKYQFSKCNNALFRGQATYDTVLFLNNDIIFEDAAYSLSEMYRFLQMDNDVGVVGAYMLYPTGRLQHGGIEMYSTGENKGLCYHPGHNGAFTAPALGYSREFVAVTGACLMMRAELFERCDYYDEAYRTEAQDVDLCLKAHRCGLSSNIVYVGKITHFENATRSKGEFNQKDRSRFIRKWSNYHEVMMNER